MSTYQIIIQGAVPSVNHVYVNTCNKGRVVRFLTQQGKAFKKQVKELFLNNYPQHEPFSNQCRVYIKIWNGDRRKRDIDNQAKVILDGMNEVVFDDDSQIVFLQMEKMYDKNNPRTQVIVEVI